jgi:Leucine-rich repeat (LRR) protein
MEKTSSSHSILMKVLAITLALVFIIGMGVPYVDPGDEPLDGEPIGGDYQSAGASGLGGAFGGFDPDFDYDDYTCDDCDEDDCTICNPPDYCYECGDCADCEVQYYCEDCKDETCPLCCGNDDCEDGCWFCTGLDCEDGNCGNCDVCHPMDVFDNNGGRPTIVPTSTPIDITDDFNDPVFLAYVLEEFGDGSVILDINVASVTKLVLEWRGISDLSGIEHFVSLTELNVEGNQLTELDVSKNTALTSLNVYWNQLTDLDVSNNIALTTLYVSENPLTELDVSKNIALTWLGAQWTQLTELDLRNNTTLTHLYVSGEQLASLDVSKNTMLTIMSVSSELLAALDVRNNTALGDLSIWGNLVSLDLSKNTALTSLYVGSDRLAALDLSNNTALTYLGVNARLATLDVSKNTALENINIWGSRLNSLNVSNNTALIYMTVIDSRLTTLDVSKNTALIELWVDSNQLTALDVSNNTQLELLRVSNNQLTTLDVSKNSQLHGLDASHNQLTSVILSAVADYYFIDLRFNNMVSESAVTGQDITWDGIDFFFSPRIVVDSISKGIEEALESGEPLVLAPGASAIITAADLKEIKDSESGWLTVVLPNGLWVHIFDIKDGAVPIDLNIAVTPVTTATTIAGTQMQAPANSVIINPSAHGQFGFTIGIEISAAQMAAAGINGDVNLYYVNSAGVVTNYGDEGIFIYSNGAAWVEITHASVYVLSSTPPVAAPRAPDGPQMGDYRTLLLPGLMIAVGLLGLGGWMYFNKRNKKAAK